MKVSYSELQKYFDTPLPAPEELADALTFHAWEIEEVLKVGTDTVLDVKVLPDKSAWALSHRGIAKDLSTTLSLPLKNDPVADVPYLVPKTEEVAVSIETPTCTRYTAALIRGVHVGPSPKWLSDFLVSMGQRSINNVVDVTNYIMFTLGQPLHAFDADKLSHNGGYKIHIRSAREDESITTLTGETYALSSGDALIVDGGSDLPIAIAGIKGGKVAEVEEKTVHILLESAHFLPVPTRISSARLKLRTDASVRFENGIVPHMAGHGVKSGAELLTEVCGGSIVGFVDTGIPTHDPMNVSVSLSKINSVLGLSLASKDVENIFNRFGFTYTTAADTFTVTAPFERPDLQIPEDYIEEIGRIYGYEHVPSVVVSPIPLREVNKHFYYSEKIRELLFTLGFSEVFTSSFRDTDEVSLENALASDKGCLRSSLYKNLHEALIKNAGNVELFGTDKVRIFEIGTVFLDKGESLKLAVGLSSKSGVTAKDLKELESVHGVLSEFLGTQTVERYEKEGVIEYDLGVCIDALAEPTVYETYQKGAEVAYVPFSNFPHAVRDIAFWTDGEVTEKDTESLIRESAGAFAVRVDCFDRFEKEGRVSYGFRIVFQSYEKTLTAEEVDAKMAKITSAVSAKGWQVR